MMMSDTHNRLLALMDTNERSRLLCASEVVSLVKDQILMQPDAIMQYAYFPTSALIVLMMQQHPDKRLALALIGHEGMLDVPMLLGMRRSHYNAHVQHAGKAWRIPVASLHALHIACPAIALHLDSYIAMRHLELAQAVLCQTFHPLQRRLPKLLLTLADRLQSPHFLITQTMLADWLGVRRVGITHAARQLQHAQIVQYRRGHMHLLNMEALMESACSCYMINKQNEAISTGSASL